MFVHDRPQVYIATQWHKDGDHSRVSALPRAPTFGIILTNQGSVTVRPGDWILENDYGIKICPKDSFDGLYEVSK